MSDICRLHLGMKPSRVKLLTSHRKRPTRENIRKAVKDALKTTKREDMVLIYYSGHGHTVQDEHYLVPQDFRYYIYFIHELYAFIFLLGNACNDFRFKSSLSYKNNKRTIHFTVIINLKPLKSLWFQNGGHPRDRYLSQALLQVVLKVRLSEDSPDTGLLLRGEVHRGLLPGER